MYLQSNNFNIYILEGNIIIFLPVPVLRHFSFIHLVREITFSHQATFRLISLFFSVVYDFS